MWFRNKHLPACVFPRSSAKAYFPIHPCSFCILSQALRYPVAGGAMSCVNDHDEFIPQPVTQVVSVDRTTVQCIFPTEGWMLNLSSCYSTRPRNIDDPTGINNSVWRCAVYMYPGQLKTWGYTCHILRVLAGTMPGYCTHDSRLEGAMLKLRLKQCLGHRPPSSNPHILAVPQILRMQNGEYLFTR